MTNETVSKKQPVNFNTKTEAGSMIYLTAIEENPENHLSYNSFYNEIESIKKLNFISMTPNPFDGLNMFVMKPLDAESCDDDADKPTFRDNFNEENSDAEHSNSQYIPDFWFDENFPIETNEVETIVKNAPDDYKIWDVYGVSIHPINGIAFNKSEQKISVSQEILVQARAPPVVSEGEILRIYYSIINFLPHSINTAVTLNIENGEFMEYQCGDQFNDVKCRQYRVQFFIPASSSLNNKEVFVRASKHGIMKVEIATNAGENVDILINVKKNDRKSKSYACIMIENLKRYDFTLGLNGKYSVNIYGNLLGNALTGLENILDLKATIIETKADKLAVSVIAYKFLQLSHLSNLKLVTDTLSNIQNLYQELVPELKTILNQNDPSNIRLVAYIASILIDMQLFTNIDQDLIQNCFYFLKSQQMASGSFPYNHELNLRREMGASLIQQHILTALVVIAFSKDKQIKQKYQFEIRKSLNFLKSDKRSFQYDYENVIAAYAFALSGDEDTYFKNRIKNTYFNAANIKNKALFVEIASYITFRKILENKDPHLEVEWLIRHRNADGGFYSSYNTVLGLQALYEYTKYKNNASPQILVPQMAVTIGNKVINIEHPLDEKIINDLNVNNVTIRSVGIGLGYATISNEIEMLTSPLDHTVFRIDSRIISNYGNKINSPIKINFEISCFKIFMNESTNLMIVELDIPSAYKYVSYTSRNKIIKAEFKSDENLLILYVPPMRPFVEFSFTIDAIKEFEVDNMFKPLIKVYDYYRPNLKNVVEYDFELHNS